MSNTSHSIVKDEFAPWNTTQEVDFTSTIVPQTSQQNKQIQNEEHFQFVSIKPKYKEKTKGIGIQSLIKQKIQKIAIDYSPKRKLPTQIQKLKPLKGNLININIINQLEQNQSPKKNTNSNILSPKGYRSKFQTKKKFKQGMKTQDVKKNYLQTNQTNLKKDKIDFQVFKRNLLTKTNSFVQNLQKSKQKYSKMSQNRQFPMLRSYSVQNVLSRSVKQDKNNKIQTIEIFQKKNAFNLYSTFNSFRLNESVKNAEIKPKLSNNPKKDLSKHIIDRLFDKLY